MADYIYLLEHRLSAAQRAALILFRQLAAENALTLFLVGGAVRDLTSGSPVRDLDFVVQGDASLLRPGLVSAGVEIVGHREAVQALYLRMPGGVRTELGRTLSASWPKPGAPVFQASSLGEDLRRRDFTANAMALSLNEGSYGLLIDPLNGVADIENRQLRLVSNYGFIEEPVRMIRAARLMARLGWTLEEKTSERYQEGQQEDYVRTLSDFERGYELEEIVHEEDPARVIKRLEAEGWMKELAPYWTSAKIHSSEMEKLHELQVQLHTAGILADSGAASFPLLTVKLSAKESATLKASFPRQGFVQEIEALESESKEFAAQLSGKTASSPSAAWKLILSAKPETVLQTAFSSRSAAVQAKLKAFLTEWPQARQKIPFAVMQEMRIFPETPGYQDLVEQLFMELLDGRLSTLEEIKLFLEPYSTPAPSPMLNMRRQRTAKKDIKVTRGRGKKEKLDSEDMEHVTSGEEEEEESSNEPNSTTPTNKEDEHLQHLSATEIDKLEESQEETMAEDNAFCLPATTSSEQDKQHTKKPLVAIEHQASGDKVTTFHLGASPASLKEVAEFTKSVAKISSISIRSSGNTKTALKNSTQAAQVGDTKNPGLNILAEVTKAKKTSKTAEKQATTGEDFGASDPSSTAKVTAAKPRKRK